MTPYGFIRPQWVKTFSGGAAKKQKVAPEEKFVVFLHHDFYCLFDKKNKIKIKKRWGLNKNCTQFADNIFICIFFEENFVTFIQISLMFVAEC